MKKFINLTLTLDEAQLLDLALLDRVCSLGPPANEQPTETEKEWVIAAQLLRDKIRYAIIK